MRSTRLTWIAVAAIAALCWSCGRGPQQGPGAKADEVGAQKPAVTDAQILADIKKLFADDPVLAAEEIEISVKDGRVSLVGTVSSGEVRIKAEDKVRTHPEVFGVDAERLLVK